MATQLTAGMRNNNPGNIKYTPSINWQGQVGPSQNTDQGDPQVVFNSQAEGMRALARNIATKYNGGATTIQQLIAGPGGWTPGYQPGANGVAAAAGLPVNQPIDMSNPSVLAQVMRGIVTQEHGPASNFYTDQMITDGISAATGTPVPPMNIPAVASDYANTSAPTPMPLRSDAAQQAVTNPDGSVNWGAFYQGLAAPSPLAAGPTGNPVSGDFSALGMQDQDPGLAAALAARVAAQPAAAPPVVPITDDASAADFYKGFGLAAPADSGATLSNFLATVGQPPTVGAPPVTRPVTSIAIGTNGQPVTSAPGGIDSVPNPGAGYDSLYGQGSSTGNIFTGQGIAGTAQLPRSVSPGAAAETQAVAAMNGGGDNGSSDASQSWANLINSFDGPYADSSVSGSKDQSQLPQGTGLSFAGPSSAPVTTTTAPTTKQVVTQQLNPAYQAWLDNQNSAIYGVEGVPSPSLDANGNVVLPSSYIGAAPAATAAPAKYLPVTKTVTVPGHTVSAAPSLGIAAAAPIVQAPIAAPNGYLYAPAAGGGYTQVGQSAQYAGMSPSAQYAAAAAPALASQTNLGGGGGNHDSQNRAGGGLTG